MSSRLIIPLSWQSVRFPVEPCSVHPSREILGFLDPRPQTALLQVASGCIWVWVLSHLPMETAVLCINITWFGAAFLYFGLMPEWAMDWIVPRHMEKQPLYVMVQGTMRFLGGMNSAMLCLSCLTLRARSRGLFENGEERRILFLAFAIGHFSQFVFNVPAFVLKFPAGRRAFRDFVEQRPGLLPHYCIRFTEDPPWPTPDSTILWVFIVDFLTFVLNLHCAMTVQDDTTAT